MSPTQLKFGTSGLRGLVTEMTDREVFVNCLGFLRLLKRRGEVQNGGDVAVAEDLRLVCPRSGLSSSPRIGAAVVRAIGAAGCTAVHVGKVPTPALAHYAMGRSARPRAPIPSVMVTGSHIPADRNGVKFYRPQGEVLKSDEADILAAVREVRTEAVWDALFDDEGTFREPQRPSPTTDVAAEAYVARYLDLFADTRPLSGRRIVLYQHSAVGRDLLLHILEGLGATVVAVERSDTFVAVDTEDVTIEAEAHYAELVREHDAFALVSTDGDSDRPLVVDERGRFHRGDVLGIVTAAYLGVDYAAVPVSVSDAVERYFADAHAVELRKTRIGSPYVIAAMQDATAAGKRGVVAWEANGGFLTATDFALGGGTLTALPTRDAALPILAALLSATTSGTPLSAVFDRLPQRATRAGLIDDVPPATSQRIVATFRPRKDAPAEVRFFTDHLEARDEAGTPTRVELESPLGRELLACRRRLARYFPANDGFGGIERINYVDGVRFYFRAGDIGHLRASGNAPQFRLYVVADTHERADALIAEAIREPDGTLRRLERDLAPQALGSLAELRRVVDASEGPREVLAIVNGGDSDLVEADLTRLATEIFRADGKTTVLAHEERTRRGQLLGLLDAIRHWNDAHGALDGDSVALGIMMPGKGTRLSPLTQRLHGIKPFLPTLVRHRPNGPWLSAAAASLYSWSLVTRSLERMGFRGIAWKWGDEPQLPATRLESLALDLREVDAVRFGAEQDVTEELAAHKEWLFAEPGTMRLVRQLRRRPRAALLASMGLAPDAPARGFVHIGSPAFSHVFLEEAAAVFEGVEGALDVDGYLFEALTSPPDAWANEVARDAGLRALLADHPDFYERVQRLRARIEARRGHPLDVRVLDFGAELYWGDVGQLDKARRTFLDVADEGGSGTLARALACVDDVVEDASGNRFVGDVKLPEGATITGSVIIDSSVAQTATIDRAILVDSTVGEAKLDSGAVAIGCVAEKLNLGERALAYQLVGESCRVEASFAATSLPADPREVGRGLETWRADMREDPGSESHYHRPVYGNPGSFADKFRQMRQREVSPRDVESSLDAAHREPLLGRLRGARD